MSDVENQMGLFESDQAPVQAAAPQMQVTPQPRPEPEQNDLAARHVQLDVPPPRKPPTRKKTQRAKGAKKQVSGLVPEGDVRLTANIRQDLHLKLKLASVYRRTTIGEIIEGLIEKYL
ncbi:MAG: hypothetical protein FPO08_16095 [Geobacter sp.]|nr:MAG: hypothetical protein FPO08_16095 [Geobacter sp.]